LSITFAISAWYGFVNKSHLKQINSIFKRAFKYGCVKSVINLEQVIVQDYDDNLFTQSNSSKPCHVSSATQSQVYFL